MDTLRERVLQDEQESTAEASAAAQVCNRCSSATQHESLLRNHRTYLYALAQNRCPSSFIRTKSVRIHTSDAMTCVYVFINAVNYRSRLFSVSIFGSSAADDSELVRYEKSQDTLIQTWNSLLPRWHEVYVH